jgi:hypothetical protein
VVAGGRRGKDDRKKNTFQIFTFLASLLVSVLSDGRGDRADEDMSMGFLSCILFL